jgi:antitoxin component YwqK of YwqJK toxin-antitoxin module
MIAAWMLCALSLPCQGSAPEVVREELAGGNVAEYEVRTSKDGSQQRHGSFSLVAPSGKQLVSGEYLAGKRSGRWRFRYEDGKPLAAGDYKGGKRTGAWTFNHENRETLAKGKYKIGHPGGEWQFWSEGGERDVLNSGQYAWIEQADLGAGQSCSGLTLDGSAHGPWVVHWPSSGVQLEGSFTRGERCGTWRFFHVDGTFDPLFLSGDHGPESYFAALVADPFPVEATPGVAEDAAGPATLDPTALGTCLPLEELAPELRALYARLRTAEGEARESGLNELRLHGRRVLPLVLEELQDIDYEAEPGLAHARRLLHELVLPLCSRHALVAPDEADPGELRLAVLRLHSLYAVASEAELWWSLDLPFTWEQGLAVPSPALLRPPLHVERLFAGAGLRGAYASRFSGRDALDKKTRQALDGALRWFAGHQDEDGRWDADEFMKHDPPAQSCDGPGHGEHDVGLTGLALLALLGDGNTTTQGPYAERVTRAVQWLCLQQDRDKGLIGAKLGSAFLYDHAIATLALCEACALSPSPLIRRAAQRAIDYVNLARNPKSVWRYDVPGNGENDSSITGWMVLALSAAQEAGLRVDPSAFENSQRWFDEMTEPTTGRVGYQDKGSTSARVPNVNDHYPVEKTEALTALALHCRYLLGQDPGEEPRMQSHAELLLKALPRWDPKGLTNDLYYWFHGTYAMHYGGGKGDKAWLAALLPALLDSQQDDGSWNPDGPWGAMGGRIYSTALMALMLEAPYRHAAPAQAR